VGGGGRNKSNIKRENGRLLIFMSRMCDAVCSSIFSKSMHLYRCVYLNLFKLVHTPTTDVLIQMVCRVCVCVCQGDLVPVNVLVCMHGNASISECVSS